MELEIPVGKAVNEVPVIVGVIVVRTPLFSTETMGLPVVAEAATEVADGCEVVGRKVDRAVAEDDVAVPKDPISRMNEFAERKG